MRAVACSDPLATSHPPSPPTGGREDRHAGDPAGRAQSAVGELPALAPFLVRPGRLLAPRRPPVPTGLAALDALLGGGFPRSRLSEVVGPRTSGRTSLLLAGLAHVTTRGGLAALVDATDGLDPASAARAGVVLERVLWVRCGGHPVTALRAADVIVDGGGFEVVAVDLGELDPGALLRIPTAALVRLQRRVEATATALLLVGPRRLAGSQAAVALALAPARARWARGGPGLLVGLTAEARLVRARDRAPGAAVRLTWAAAGA